MTREESVSILKTLIPKDSRGNGKVKTNIAITEAILNAVEALEQEPCEDCISRKAVRDTIFAKCSGENLDIDFAKVMLLQRAIKAIPSATPQEPRKGEWQLTDDEMFVYCPFCQETEYERPIDASWKYCPDCGARLD